MNTKYKFQYFVFGVAIYNYSVAKYLADDGSVMIRIEFRSVNDERNGNRMIFENEHLYSEFVNRVIESDQELKDAQCLNLLIDAINSHRKWEKSL